MKSFLTGEERIVSRRAHREHREEKVNLLLIEKFEQLFSVASVGSSEAGVRHKFSETSC